MENLKLVNENIEAIINRLKQLETEECRKIYGSRITIHKKYATEMLRALIKHREDVESQIKQKEYLYKMN
jgi:hypothetical protein